MQWIPDYGESPNGECPHGHGYLVRQWDWSTDPPKKLELWRCRVCAQNGNIKFIYKTNELLGAFMNQKKVEYTWTHLNSIVDIKFILIPKRNWFAENVKPAVDMLKSSIPAVSREWNGNTQKWSIAAEFWPATKQLFELMGFTAVETLAEDRHKIPGVEVPAEYAENFHYESEVITTQESAESIAQQLSIFLGVKITDQDLKDLKKLYRAKALELHPDRGGDATKMSELNRLWTLYNQGGIQ
jgi:hypothetical protein